MVICLTFCGPLHSCRFALIHRLKFSERQLLISLSTVGSTASYLRRCIKINLPASIIAHICPSCVFIFFTLLVQQHHDAVAVGVAVEMSGDDVTVLPADGDQPLVVASSYRSGVSDIGQVPHRDMSYDVHLDQEVSHIKGMSIQLMILSWLWGGSKVQGGSAQTFSWLWAAFSSLFSSHSYCPAGSVMLHVTLSGP